MDEDARARRTARRASADWEFGIARSHEAHEAEELEWWASLSLEVRLQACFDASEEAWSIRPRQADDVEPGPAFGVRPLGTE